MMNLIQKLITFYIESSIHVALSVYALVQITFLYFYFPQNKSFGYFVFFATIVGYNFVKYDRLVTLKHKSTSKGKKLIQLFTAICSLLMLFYGLKLSLKVIITLIPFAVLTFFYATPFLKSTKNLRNIASAKILIIAFVWSGTTVLLPILNTSFIVDSKLILIAIQRFLFVIVLTLPFDIRDFRFDKKHLQTIPQLIGVNRTKKVGFVLLLFCSFIEIFIAPNGIFKSVFFIVFLVLSLFLQGANIYQNKYYCSFWIEGIPVFWWILLMLIPF